MKKVHKQKDEVPETPLEEEEDLVPAKKQVIKPTYDFQKSPTRNCPF